MPDSLSRQLARWAVNLAAADLPPAVVNKMQTSLLHATVVAIVGAANPSRPGCSAAWLWLRRPRRTAPASWPPEAAPPAAGRRSPTAN